MNMCRSKFFVLVMTLAFAVCAFGSACTAVSSDSAVQAEATIDQAWPRWIAISGKLDKTEMHPRGILPVDNVIDPVDNRPVFRMDSNEPGSNSPGVTMVYGHSYTDASGEFVPFSKLELVQPGDTIVLGTDNGELSYVVEKTLTVPKSELDLRADVHENVPNRLVLITCDITAEGEDTLDNMAIFAQLKV